MKALRAALTTLTIVLGAISAQAQAQECGGDFEQWRAGVAAEARADGVGNAGLRALAAAQFDTRILARDRGQSVFTQDFDQFAGRMVNAYRLGNGAANMRKYAGAFSQAQQQYGVPAPVITAFWALETDFGAVQGDFSTLNALATLAHDCRRPALFRPHLIALLKLIEQGVLPADVTGAWAGEIGQIQMLPGDYLNEGVDGDGDGRVDLRRSVPDVILTAGRLISRLGWRAGEPWMEEVRVPDDLPWAETGRTNRLPLSQWAAWGVTTRDGGALGAGPDAGLVLPMGHKGPAFLVYENYDVYLEWNQSFVYTLTAAHLARRLAGDPAYRLGNPEPGLSPEQMRALQEKLVARGHDVGGIDGVLGVNTREAIRKEQMRLGFPVDGWPTPRLLAAL